MLNLFFIATSFLFVRWTGQAKCYWEINMDCLNGFGENCKFWELINRVMLNIVLLEKRHILIFKEFVNLGEIQNTYVAKFPYSHA